MATASTTAAACTAPLPLPPHQTPLFEPSHGLQQAVHVGWATKDKEPLFGNPQTDPKKLSTSVGGGLSHLFRLAIIPPAPPPPPLPRLFSLPPSNAYHEKPQFWKRVKPKKRLRSVGGGLSGSFRLVIAAAATATASAAAVLKHSKVYHKKKTLLGNPSDRFQEAVKVGWRGAVRFLQVCHRCCRRLRHSRHRRCLRRRCCRRRCSQPAPLIFWSHGGAFLVLRKDFLSGNQGFDLPLVEPPARYARKNELKQHGITRDLSTTRSLHNTSID